MFIWISLSAFIISLLQGLSVLAVVFMVFIFALYLKKSESEARTLAFATLVFANIILILTNLSWLQNLNKIIRSKNYALRWVVGSTLVSLILVLYVPFLRNLFHFYILPVPDLLIAFVGGIVSLLWFEGLKILNKKSNK